MTKVRLDEPDLLADLVEDLRSRSDIVVGAVDDDTVEVTVLGSYDSEAMRLAIYLRVRAWEAGQRAQGKPVRVELV
jgi:hypothetical protein